MTTREQIVAEAREWIGTRWQHQAAIKGVATDCIGLIRGVGASCGRLPHNLHQLPEVAEFLGYGRTPDGRLPRFLDLFFDKTSDPQPGDIPLMRFTGEPQHVGILSDKGIIHAYAQVRKVVEHRMDAVWTGRVVAYYTWRGLE